MRLPLRSDYGTILLGSADQAPSFTRLRVQIVMTVGILGANLVGVGFAVALAIGGIAEPPIPWDAWWINFLVVPGYIVFAFLVGAGLGTVRIVRSLRWSIRQEEPTATQAAAALSAPWRLTKLLGALWLGGTVVLTTAYGLIDPQLIPKVALVIGLSGIVVCAIAYQIAELALRPSAAAALEAGFQPPRRGRLRIRAAMAWAIGSGVPILGIFLVVVFGTFRDDTSKLDVFVSVAALAATALVTGPLLTVLNTDTLVAPLRVLNNAIRRVRDGDTEAKVRIFDGSDMGELQAGFNAMTAGLHERERLRDLFGRHVGREVAEVAIGSESTELGGAEIEVGVVFVDVVGSTTLARRHSPTEVVDLLNRFFEVIVTEVEANHGLVNKFEGDAVLAVFGAPLRHRDPAAGALRTARRIAERLARSVPDLSAGVGVSYGTVVAGNVGATERFEYTVIGDPVNESARLSEIAKADPTTPLASGEAIAAAADRESGRWQRVDEVTLRGRDEPTELHAPSADADDSADPEPTPDPTPEPQSVSTE